MGPLRLLSLAILGGSLLTGPAHAAVAEEIIVKRAPGLSAAERADMRADADVAFGAALRLPRVELVRAEPGERAKALTVLNADPAVVWAEPNRERHMLTTDPYFADLWGLDNTGQFVLGRRGTADADIDAPEAWLTSRGEGVIVAVVDTGVQPDHPDLAVLRGYDFVDGGTTPPDRLGHGTHVAGTIAALENATGVVGVAPQAEILPVRVLDESGNGSTADVADGLDFAGDGDVRVVNASLGSYGYSSYERDAIAAHPNTLFVVAAGNDGSDNDRAPIYPCDYGEPNIVCVGASNSDDYPARFSNFGDSAVDLFAPGETILSSIPTSGYAWSDGTSMASPHVAGVAALLTARAPGAGPPQLKRALLDAAETKPALAGLSVTGGRLNAAAALVVLGGLDVTAPAPPAGATATGGDRGVTLGWDASSESDLAGYRVRAVPDRGVTTIVSPGLTLAGLAAGATYTYTVSAVDQVGNESPRTTVSATTSPAPAAPGPPLMPLPPAPLSPQSPPSGSDGIVKVTGARVRGRVRLCRAPCRVRRARLVFTLSAATRVRLTLARRTCRLSRCTYAAVAARTISQPGGRRSLSVGAKLAGMTLRPGVWRVTLETARDRASASFEVHAG